MVDSTAAMAILAYMVGVPVAGLVSALAAECLIGSLGRRPPELPSCAPPFVVLMPAHDEAQGISQSVRAVTAQLRHCDSLIVIADNCSDDTAELARTNGAIVAERFDPDRRGKGYALEFGREMVAAGEAEVVIIVDADCLPGPGALHRLATAAACGPTVQGAYLLTPGETGSPMVDVSCFAFFVKNLIRQRALFRLTGMAVLQGSGMAFSRSVFLGSDWRADSLVEDLAMGVDLLIAGSAVAFDERATFFSNASSVEGTLNQRRRWEHGALAAVGSFVVPLISAALSRKQANLLVLALDLLVPPTTLLIGASAMATVLAFALTGWSALLFALVSANLLLGLGLASAWRAYGRVFVRRPRLWVVARYLWWKLPIMLQFFTDRQKLWVRTDRDV